jgi:prefoldin subunit 5
MLVPLTASLYVPGSLDDAEKVLVDVGTGYFIEVTWLLVVVLYMTHISSARKL